MVEFCFNNVSIRGICSVVPKKEILLTDDPNLYNGDKKRIKRVIESSGFYKRRIVEKNTTSSDLCFYAACNLIKDLKINTDTIDALVFVSYTPDYLMPATAYVLHKKLKLSQNCIVMDIPQACSGYIIGLYQASMLINSGCKKVLLLVGDTFSKFTDMFLDHSAPVFGDAGSATLIEYKESAEKVYFNINSDGSGFDSLICQNGAFRHPIKKADFYPNEEYKYEAKMDGGKIFEFTMNNIVPSIENLLKFANISISDIDEYIFHQANKFILENLARKLNIPQEKISTETLTNYGNQCGASIPCTICNVYKEKSSKSDSKYLFSGFGAGLSWANAIVNLDKIYCSNLLEYGG